LIVVRRAQGYVGGIMLSFAPANIDQVAEALNGVDPNRPVEIAPDVPLAGVQTVSDLLALHEWPPGLRLTLEDDGVVFIDRIEDQD
jgi:hypothetical protein